MSLLEEKNLTVIRASGPLPKIPYRGMVDALLGKKYILTIIFCTPKESQDLNKIHRNKNYPTNILSFPLGVDEGEIYISLSTARGDAKKFEMSYLKFLHLLMIHGCLHLKGYDHGSTMEELEEKHLKTFFRGA